MRRGHVLLPWLAASLLLARAARAGEDELAGPSLSYWIEQVRRPDAAECRGDPERVFRELGPKAAPAVPALVWLFDDRSRDVRSRATRAVACIGAAAVPALVRVLATGSVQAALCACGALEGMGSAADRATPALLVALKARTGEVRGAAAAALGAIGGDEPAVRDALRPLLDDPGASNRARAALALFRRGEPAEPCVAALVEILRTGDDDDAAWAARALGRMGPAAKPALGAIVESFGRRGAKSTAHLAALGDLNPDAPAALPVLLAALDVPAPRDVRHAAAQALGRCRSEAAIVALLARDRRAGFARSALGYLRPEADPALRAALRHDEAAIRGAAARWWADRHGYTAEAVAALVSCLDAESVPAVLGATNEIAKAGAAGAPAVPALVRNLSRLRNYPSAMLATVRALGRLGVMTPAVRMALHALLQSPDHALRLEAEVALTRLGR